LVQAPCMVVHGQKDVTVLPRHGEELYKLCRSRKRFVSPPDLDHNANLLRNRELMIEPLLEFFDLPQTSTLEMQVPSWALACEPRLRLEPSMSYPGFCSRSFFDVDRANGETCGACRQLPVCGGVPRLPGPLGMDAVEDTLAGAVEHILAGGRDEGWTEDFGEGRRGPGERSPHSVAPRDSDRGLLSRSHASPHFMAKVPIPASMQPGMMPAITAGY